MSSMYPPSYGGGMPPQRCQRCGTPLPPNETYCRTCGAYNAPPAQTGGPPSGMSWGEPTSQTYGGGQYGGQQWGPPSAPPATNMPYGGTNTPQQPFPNSAYGVPNPPSSPNNFYAAPPQNGYTPPSFNGQNGYAPPSPASMNGYTPPVPPNMNGYTPPSPAMMNGYPPDVMRGMPAQQAYNQWHQGDQPSQRRRRPNVGLIVTIVVLLLLLVGAGVGGYILIKKSRTSSPVVVTPTVTMKATPTPTGKLMYSDAFKNNSNGWDLTNGPGNKVTVNLGGGSLVLADNENTLFPEFIPGKNFSDFQLNVDGVLSKGNQSNGYGIYIRVAPTQNDNLGTYYRFEVYGDGTFAVFKGIVDANGNSTSTNLTGFLNGPSIQKQGSLNHITILAKGSTMEFIVNGVTLKTVIDASYKSGAIALFVSNVTQVTAGADAAFSHLAIYAVSK